MSMMHMAAVFCGVSGGTELDPIEDPAEPWGT